MYHMSDDRVQCNELKQNLLYQIEALRSHTWVQYEDVDDDSHDVVAMQSSSPNSRGAVLTPAKRATPDHKTIRLMAELIKTHNALQESIIRRFGNASR